MRDRPSVGLKMPLVKHQPTLTRILPHQTRGCALGNKKMEKLHFENKAPESVVHSTFIGPHTSLFTKDQAVLYFKKERILLKQIAWRKTSI